MTGRRFLTALPLLGFLAFGCTNDAPQDDDRGFSKIVYAVRTHTIVGEDGSVSVDVAGGMGQVMDYLRYNPGARLEIRDLNTGVVENIIDGDRYKNADVSSFDVSFDAQKVVFSMKLSGDDDYHLYTADVTRGETEKNPFNIHQLTFGPHDDIHPQFVSGGRIAFVTAQPYTEMGTRADEYNHSRIVTQIGTITVEGGDADRKLCSQNLSHTINLRALSDGRVLFSRWEHLENVNDVKLFSMNPDCTQMVAMGGQHGKPANSLVQLVETKDPNVFVGVATSREDTIQAGALVEINVGAEHDATVVDEERAVMTVITDGVPTGEEPSPVGRYRAPAVLPDGRILTSWAAGFVNALDELALSPPDFGIYIYDKKTKTNELVVNYEGSWELYALPLTPRAEPPIIGSIQNSQDPTVPVQLGSIDVRSTSLAFVHGETVSGAQFDGTPTDVALASADRVRIIEGFSSEAAAGVNMFGLTMAEGAAILGEAKVEEDGSWLAEIPPFIPVHLQPIDEFDLAIRNQTTWIQGMPGESRVCGGCHEERVGVNTPTNQQLSIAAGRGAQDFMVAVNDRIEYPWINATAGNPNEIQAIFNDKCVACHNGTTNGSRAQEYYTVTVTDEIAGTAVPYQVPRLDLTDTPVTVEYDMEVQDWPASYVSIFYPAAMEMEMDDAMVAGTVPPMWGIPSDARNSKLIEKLNVTSVNDAGIHAWPLGQGFTDANIQGASRTDHAAEVGLTREEIVKLIRAIDMGGQYYARQNTDFVPFDNNPLGRNY